MKVTSINTLYIKLTIELNNMLPPKSGILSNCKNKNILSENSQKPVIEEKKYLT
jgi:hypothetical protein